LDFRIVILASGGFKPLGGGDKPPPLLSSFDTYPPSEFYSFRLPHACRGIVPFLWDDDGSDFRLQSIPPSKNSHFRLQIPPTFSPSQLLTFFFPHFRIPTSTFRIITFFFSAFRIPPSDFQSLPTSDFLTLNPLLQHKALNFTAGRLRDIFYELDPARVFICRNALPDKLLDVFLQIIDWLHFGI